MLARVMSYGPPEEHLPQTCSAERHVAESSDSEEMKSSHLGQIPSTIPGRWRDQIPGGESGEASGRIELRRMSGEGCRLNHLDLGDILPLLASWQWLRRLHVLQ
jgi:hypothetical protein